MVGRWERRTLAAAAAALVALAASTSGARAQVVVVGSVRTDSGRAVAGAEVAIPTLGLGARTDEAGRYRIAGVAPGDRLIEVRHIGYKPLSKVVAVSGDSARVDFTLEADVVRLDSVVARATPDPYMREFEENRRLGLGHFFTRAELEKAHVERLVEALDAIPGSRLERGRGNRAWVISNRVSPTTPTPIPDFTDRERGAPRACYSRVYLDNVNVYRGRDEEPLFDVNSIPIAAIEAIEYYAGPSQTPARYGGPAALCGALVIWTRRS